MPQYTMYLIRDKETNAKGSPVKEGENGYSESGRIVLCDPEGKYVGEYHYNSGGASLSAKWRGTDGTNYSLPNQDYYEFGNDTKGNMAKPVEQRAYQGQMEKFYEDESNKSDVHNGVRLANSNFMHRSSFLMHEDRGIRGTLGCIGIVPKDWDKLEPLYLSMKPEEVPLGIQTIDRTEYAAIRMGILPQDKSPRANLCMNEPSQQQILDQNSTFRSGLESYFQQGKGVGPMELG